MQLFVFFGQEVVNFIVPAIHFLIAQLNTLFDFSLGSVFFVSVLDDEEIEYSWLLTESVFEDIIPCF